MSGIVHLPSSGDFAGAAGDTIAVATVIDDDRYAEGLTNRVLRCLPGSSLQRRNDTADTYLFVLSGEGNIYVGDANGTLGESQHIAYGSASLVLAGHPWVIEVESGELVLTDTAVPAPPLPNASALARETGEYRSVVRLGEAEREAATGAREFEVLYGPSRGSRGATQFVGFIPPSGAPSHYHLYDEICVVVSGKGLLHAGGETGELSAGATFHVPPRWLHAVENTQEKEDLWMLGLFRPAGSAAAAFYPDGAPAPNNMPEHMLEDN